MKIIYTSDPKPTTTATEYADRLALHLIDKLKAKEK